MEGKEIKQAGIVNRNIEVKVVDGKTIINQSSKFDCDAIVVKSEHLKELALAICPELQSELEKAKELIRTSRVIILCAKREEALKWTGAEGYDEVDEWANNHHDIKELTTFLEGSGNKTK